MAHHPHLSAMFGVGVLVVSLAADVAVSSQKEKDKTWASIEGNVIRLNPSGATFKIPERWLKWHAGFKNNLHLTRAELDKVKTAEGDWDTEYAHIANELLPFSQCVAHVGGEGWGRDAVSYADLQMRAYLTDTSAENVQTKLAKHGKAWASKYSKDVSVTQSKHDKWHRASVTYVLSYGDYGGKATVDVYAQEIGKQTAVLVFMHSDYRGASGPVEEILKSFAWRP